MKSMKNAWRSIAMVGISAALALTATPALAKKPVAPPNGTFLGGCDASLVTPNATACAGYYTGNILNGSPADILNQQNAIASLPGSFTWDGNWSGLDNSTSPDLVITALTNGNELDFGTTLFGQVIIGAHFGNIQDSLGNTGNVSVFWLFDFGTTGADYVVLDNTRGFSNAALYTNGTPPPGVPEPSTWAMMLLGFGAAGVAVRRSRQKVRLLSQLA